MELRAILEAILFWKDEPMLGGVEIVTDSTYALNCVEEWIWGWRRNGWVNGNRTAVSNRELLAEIASALDTCHGKFRFSWVKGHLKAL
jgi:ribonuclease HI